MQFGFRVSRVQVLQRTDSSATPSGRNAVHMLAWCIHTDPRQSGRHNAVMTRTFREARMRMPCAHFGQGGGEGGGEVISSAFAHVRMYSSGVE